MYTFRSAESENHDALGAVMFNAIHVGNTQYSEAQRNAWMPNQNHGEAWSKRLSSQHVFMATKAQTPVGFMTLDNTGYIDFAYVLNEARGQGVFRGLLDLIEQIAKSSGLTTLTTHASLMAQPAFGHFGFEIVQHEDVRRQGETLRRAEMTKSI